MHQVHILAHLKIPVSTAPSALKKVVDQQYERALADIQNVVDRLTDDTTPLPPQPVLGEPRWVRRD